jgi:hypothetical protein
MQTYDNDLAYMFDRHIAERVVALLNTFDIPADVDEYEMGMCQVRIDPTDRTQPHGWVFVAGQGNDMTLGWFAIKTALDDENLAEHSPPNGLYYTVDTFEPHNLGLPITAEPGQIAPAIMSFLAERSAR